jgi:hypothetical protein
VRSEAALAHVFVQIADTLVTEFDIVEFLQQLCDRCVQLLEIDAAGLLLADAAGRLQLMEATSEQARLLELFQLQQQEGPCLECHHDGAAVVVPDIAATGWPRFAPACQQVGFAAVHALRMRCREQWLGGCQDQVLQASGMISIQLGVGVDEALVRLRAHAYAHDRRITDVARDVIARRLRFDPAPDPG